MYEDGRGLFEFNYVRRRPSMVEELSLSSLGKQDTHLQHLATGMCAMMPWIMMMVMLVKTRGRSDNLYLSTHKPIYILYVGIYTYSYIYIHIQ